MPRTGLTVCAFLVTEQSRFAPRGTPTQKTNRETID